MSTRSFTLFFLGLTMAAFVALAGPPDLTPQQRVAKAIQEGVMSPAQWTELNPTLQQMLSHAEPFVVPEYSNEFILKPIRIFFETDFTHYRESQLYQIIESIIEKHGGYDPKKPNVYLKFHTQFHELLDTAPQEVLAEIRAVFTKEGFNEVQFFKTSYQPIFFAQYQEGFSAHGAEFDLVSHILHDEAHFKKILEVLWVPHDLETHKEIARRKSIVKAYEKAFNTYPEALIEKAFANHWYQAAHETPNPIVFSPQRHKDFFAENSSRFRVTLKKYAGIDWKEAGYQLPLTLDLYREMLVVARTTAIEYCKEHNVDSAFWKPLTKAPNLSAKYSWQDYNQEVLEAERQIDPNTGAPENRYLTLARLTNEKRVHETMQADPYFSNLADGPSEINPFAIEPKYKGIDTQWIPKPDIQKLIWSPQDLENYIDRFLDVYLEPKAGKKSRFNIAKTAFKETQLSLFTYKHQLNTGNPIERAFSTWELLLRDVYIEAYELLIKEFGLDPDPIRLGLKAVYEQDLYQGFDLKKASLSQRDIEKNPELIDHAINVRFIRRLRHRFFESKRARGLSDIETEPVESKREFDRLIGTLKEKFRWELDAYIKNPNQDFKKAPAMGDVSKIASSFSEAFNKPSARTDGPGLSINGLDPWLFTQVWTKVKNIWNSSAETIRRKWNQIKSSAIALTKNSNAKQNNKIIRQHIFDFIWPMALSYTEDIYPNRKKITREIESLLSNCSEIQKQTWSEYAEQGKWNVFFDELHRSIKSTPKELSQLNSILFEHTEYTFSHPVESNEISTRRIYENPSIIQTEAQSKNLVEIPDVYPKTYQSRNGRQTWTARPDVRDAMAFDLAKELGVLYLPARYLTLHQTQQSLRAFLPEQSIEIMDSENRRMYEIPARYFYQYQLSNVQLLFSYLIGNEAVDRGHNVLIEKNGGQSYSMNELRDRKQRIPLPDRFHMWLFDANDAFHYNIGGSVRNHELTLSKEDQVFLEKIKQLRFEDIDRILKNYPDTETIQAYKDQAKKNLWHLKKAYVLQTPIDLSAELIEFSKDWYREHLKMEGFKRKQTISTLTWYEAETLLDQMTWPEFEKVAEAFEAQDRAKIALALRGVEPKTKSSDSQIKFLAILKKNAESRPPSNNSKNTYSLMFPFNLIMSFYEGGKTTLNAAKKVIARPRLERTEERTEIKKQKSTPLSPIAPSDCPDPINPELLDSRILKVVEGMNPQALKTFVCAYDRFAQSGAEETEALKLAFEELGENFKKDTRWKTAQNPILAGLTRDFVKAAEDLLRKSLKQDGFESNVFANETAKHAKFLTAMWIRLTCQILIKQLKDGENLNPSKAAGEASDFVFGRKHLEGFGLGFLFGSYATSTLAKMGWAEWLSFVDRLHPEFKSKAWHALAVKHMPKILGQVGFGAGLIGQRLIDRANSLKDVKTEQALRLPRNHLYSQMDRVMGPDWIRGSLDPAAMVFKDQSKIKETEKYVPWLEDLHSDGTRIEFQGTWKNAFERKVSLLAMTRFERWGQSWSDLDIDTMFALEMLSITTASVISHAYYVPVVSEMLMMIIAEGLSHMLHEIHEGPWEKERYDDWQSDWNEKYEAYLSNKHVRNIVAGQKGYAQNPKGRLLDWRWFYSFEKAAGQDEAFFRDVKHETLSLAGSVGPSMNKLLRVTQRALREIDKVERWEREQKEYYRKNGALRHYKRKWPHYDQELMLTELYAVFKQVIIAPESQCGLPSYTKNIAHLKNYGWDGLQDDIRNHIRRLTCSMKQMNWLIDQNKKWLEDRSLTPVFQQILDTEFAIRSKYEIENEESDWSREILNWVIQDRVESLNTMREAYRLSRSQIKNLIDLGERGFIQWMLGFSNSAYVKRVAHSYNADEKMKNGRWRIYRSQFPNKVRIKIQRDGKEDERAIYSEITRAKGGTVTFNLPKTLRLKPGVRYYISIEDVKPKKNSLAGKKTTIYFADTFKLDELNSN